jgi:Ca2+-binding RTX toxin-like protein
MNDELFLNNYMDGLGGNNSISRWGAGDMLIGGAGNDTVRACLTEISGI